MPSPYQSLAVPENQSPKIDITAMENLKRGMEGVKTNLGRF
jgi:hypothetical protein